MRRPPGGDSRGGPDRDVEELAAGKGVKLRPALPEEGQLLWLWGVAAAGALLLWPFLPRLAGLLPGCPFKRLTGLPCLSCGTTRAALSLLRGDLAAAFRFNPISAAIGISFLAGGLLAPVWALLRWPVPDALPAATPARRVAGIAFLVAAWGWQVIRGI